MKEATGKVYYFNKLDEHFIIPVISLCSVASIIVLIYLLNEASKSQELFIKFYKWESAQILNYRLSTLLLGSGFLLILLVSYISFKVKKRWLYIAVFVAYMLMFFVGLPYTQQA